LAESCKLDPWPLDEGPRPKIIKWQFEAKPTWHCSGVKVNLLRPKKKRELKGELMIWRTKMQAKV